MDNFEGDFILQLKSDYKDIINLLLEKQENNMILNINNKKRNLLQKKN